MQLIFSDSRIISVPLPSHRLANAAIRSLKVDAELSPLVKRSFSLTTNAHEASSLSQENGSNSNDDSSSAQPQTNGHAVAEDQTSAGSLTVLRTEYRATTNRMLRVSVNGFMESLGVVLEVMQKLDVDVLAEKG